MKKEISKKPSTRVKDQGSKVKSQNQDRENTSLNKTSKTVLEKKWYLVDAKNKVLGRLSTKIAKLLMGKDKAGFVRYKDSGDYVVVINAAKIAVSGTKEKNKKYYNYSGYPSGLKETTLGKLRARKPEEIVRHAVSGMLPKNRLAKAIIKKLYICPKEDHPHEPQKPTVVELN